MEYETKMVGPTSQRGVGSPGGWWLPSVVDDVRCTPRPCRAIRRDIQNMGTIQSFTGGAGIAYLGWLARGGGREGEENTPTC